MVHESVHPCPEVGIGVSNLQQPEGENGRVFATKGIWHEIRRSLKAAENATFCCMLGICFTWKEKDDSSPIINRSLIYQSYIYRCMWEINQRSEDGIIVASILSAKIRDISMKHFEEFNTTLDSSEEPVSKIICYSNIFIWLSATWVGSSSMVHIDRFCQCVCTCKDSAWSWNIDRPQPTFAISVFSTLSPSDHKNSDALLFLLCCRCTSASDMFCEEYLFDKKRDIQCSTGFTPEEFSNRQ